MIGPAEPAQPEPVHPEPAQSQAAQSPAAQPDWSYRTRDDGAGVVQPAESRGRWLPPGWAAADLRAGGIIVFVLAAAGVLLGIVWAYWSPARPAGFVLAAHAVQPDDTEAFIAADGRYALICAAFGLLAGTSVWFVRSLRGPLGVLCLGVGALVGAQLTEVVGHLLGGGSGTAAVGSVIAHLPLSVHMNGLRLVEAIAAILVYGLCVAFAESDDLGRPDPRSVRLGGEPQHGWGQGNAAGAVHQPDLSP